MIEHDSIAADGLSEREIYKLLTGIVVPRPIAWITTRNEDRTVNLAPFSAFVILANDPPLIGVSIGRRGAELKDTTCNIKRTGQFVVNSVHESQSELVHRSSEELPAHVSEVDELGLSTIEGYAVDVPRLAGASTSMECEFVQAIEFGRAKTELLVGQVRHLHVKAGLLVGGKIDTARLEPLGRVAGPSYAALGDVVTYRALQHTLYTERAETDT